MHHPRRPGLWIRRVWMSAGILWLISGAPAPVRAAWRLSPDSLLAASQAYDRGDSIQAGQLLSAWALTAPSDPRPDLLRLQWAWWEVLDGRDVDGAIERRLRARFDTLAVRCEAVLARDPGDCVAAYTLGEAHCLVGRLDGLTGSAWGALRHHQKGLALLGRVRDAAPEAPEPRASIGVFRYYAARMPRSVRALGRLVRVRGDRQAGLTDLRAAAAAAGLQQTQARFFLVHILNDSEDDNLEALDWVLRLRAAAPRRVAVALEHADVLADLERPDLAVRLLLDVAGDADPVGAVQCRFLAGRIECETGRFESAARRFDALGTRATAQVTWLAPWLAVYRGQIAVVRGDAGAARQYWNAARELPDAAGSQGAGEGAALRFADPVEPYRMAVEEALAWDAPRDTLRARTVALDARARGRMARVDYTRGSAWLRLGDSARAAALLASVEAGGEDAWLAARTATRLLVALRAAGDAAGAARVARRIAARTGEWGVPAALASLARVTLEQPVPPGPVAADARNADPAAAVELRLASVSTSPGTVRELRLKDQGFATVDLLCLHDGRLETVPMGLAGGWWSHAWAAPAAGFTYSYRINGVDRTPDPESRAVWIDADGAVWSRPAP